MKNRIKVLPILVIYMILQSCTDYHAFDRGNGADATLIFSNRTKYSIKISIDNIALMPGESKTVFVGGDTIYHLWSIWGDTISFLYDDGRLIRHMYTSSEHIDGFIPDTNNVLDANSWIYIGDNRIYEYNIL